MVTGFDGNFAVWRNGLFAKKYLYEGSDTLIDVRLIKDTYVYNEFDDVENTYWFDFKKTKFLHNIEIDGTPLAIQIDNTNLFPVKFC